MIVYNTNIWNGKTKIGMERGFESHPLRYKNDKECFSKIKILENHKKQY